MEDSCQMVKPTAMKTFCDYHLHLCLQKMGDPWPMMEEKVMTVMIGGCRARMEIILGKSQPVEDKCPHARLDMNSL